MRGWHVARVVSVLFLLLVLSGRAAAESGDLVRTIPALSPAVVVLNNPGKTIGDLRNLFVPGDEGQTAAKRTDAGNGLLDLLRPESAPDGIDLSSPMAIAMPQFPFPLIAVSVSDYDLFIKSLHKQFPSATQQPSPLPSDTAGIDSVVVAGRPLFCRRDGSFALLSTMPLLLTPPAEGGSLAAVLTGEESSLLEGGDLYLRVDMGTILALLEPLIQQSLGRLDLIQPDNTPPSPGAPQVDPGRLIGAEMELILKGLRQVQSISTGGTIREKGLSLTTLYLPREKSPFARLIGSLRAGPHPLLRFLDGDAVLAGAFRFDSKAFAGMVAAVSDFLFESGIYNLGEEERGEWNGLIESGLAVAGGESAFLLGPSASGGVFSTMTVTEVTDTSRARVLMHDSLSFSEKLLVAGGEPLMKLALTEGAEEHRGVSIDRFSFSFSIPEEEKGEEYDTTMKTLFGGGNIEMWVAFFNNMMVTSSYVPSPVELKKMIDRLMDGGEGDLLGTPAFRSATGSLPESNVSISYFSFPRFVSLIVDMMRQVDPKEILPPWPLEENRASGIGVTYSTTGSSLRVDTRIPGLELENIRLVMEYLKSLEKQKPGLEGPGTKKSVPL